MKRSSFLGLLVRNTLPVTAALLLIPGSAQAQAEIFKQLRWFQMTTTLKSAASSGDSAAEGSEAVAPTSLESSPEATTAATSAASPNPSPAVVSETSVPASAAAPAETTAPAEVNVAKSLESPVAATSASAPHEMPTSSVAESVTETSGWTFEQLMVQAMSHPAIQTKGALSNAAQADVDAANWQKYPTPSLEAAMINGQRPSTYFQLKQPLWTAGRITAGIDAAGFRQQGAAAEMAETQREIALRVIAAFTEAQRQQARQTFAIKSVREHEKLLRLITRRVETQVSPDVDKGFAQSRLFQSMNDLSLVTQQLSHALNQLSQLTGKSVLRVTPVSTETIDIPAKRSTAMDQALTSSPTLVRIAAEEEAAQADIESKKSAYMPQVSARYAKSFAAGGDSQLMLVLEAQPGAGLSAQSGVDAAIAKRESIRLSREVATRDLKEQLTTDWDALLAARLRQENAEQAKRMAGDVFDSYARQYTLGRKTWIDVLNAVRESAQAEMATADAAAEVLAAVQRLRLLTGGLNIGFVAPLSKNP